LQFVLKTFVQKWRIVKRFLGGPGQDIFQVRIGFLFKKHFAFHFDTQAPLSYTFLTEKEVAITYEI